MRNEKCHWELEWEWDESAAGGSRINHMKVKNKQKPYQTVKRGMYWKVCASFCLWHLIFACS